VLALAGLTLAIWSYLTLLHGRFWLTAPRLPDARELASWPAVAVVVPARDEEEMVARTLPALAAQDYPGRFRLLLVDDNSTDGTAAVAGAVPRCTLLRGTATPSGWAGKVWALQQGLCLVHSDFPAEFILFTDADILHPADSLRRLVSHAMQDHRDTVSLMARLRCESPAERWLIPAFVYFFAQLYPFRRVNSRRLPTAAAAGGCLLVRTASLPPSGLESMREALIDDVATARLVRANGGQPWLGYTSEVLSLRAYPHVSDIWSMVSRSAWVQLRRSWLLLSGTVLGLLLVYTTPVVLTFATGGTPRWLGLAAWALMAATFVPISRLYRRPALSGLALPLIALTYSAMTIDSARRGGAAWKGRPPPS
jgi:hopene-associated glycosyltransferase HpnB